MGIVVDILTIVAHGAAVVLLFRQWGPAAGAIAYAAAAIALTCVAGLLLLNVKNDTVTWKNRLAGFLLPWSTFVGGGRLYALLIKNALAFLVFGGLAAVAYHGNLWNNLSPKPADAAGQLGWMEAIVYWLTVACWAAMLGAWLWMLRSFNRHSLDVVSILLRRRGAWLPLLLPPIATGASIALRLSGQAWPALLLASIPLLIFLLPVLLMTTVILAHYLTGKPIRWN